jgi:hypothetical protein
MKRKELLIHATLVSVENSRLSKLKKPITKGHMISATWNM